MLVTPAPLVGGDQCAAVPDAGLCIHSRRCVAALPTVFRPGEQPWVAADAASADEVAAAVDGCPSGALRYTRDARSAAVAATQPETTPTPVVEVTVEAGGPNTLVGPVELVRRTRRVSLCRCGASATKPFCDGSHERIGFDDPGPAGAASS